MVWKGLEGGRRIREFSKEDEAREWLSRRKNKLFHGKKLYSIKLIKTKL